MFGVAVVVLPPGGGKAKCGAWQDLRITSAVKWRMTYATKKAKYIKSTTTCAFDLDVIYKSANEPRT